MTEPYVLVNQKDEWDCGLACAAMLTREKYEDILKLYLELGGAFGKGTDTDTLLDILRNRGFAVKRFFSFYPAFEAIVAVPSLNHPGRNHFIFWDGSKVLDPQQGRPGKLFYTAEFMFGNTSFNDTITHAVDFIEAEQ